ncbi:RsmB/NOP family class I SAM-dependent RNA methyltransferase [Algiphilus sp.]|uniref:RsmB/NOP family class I SAM-dependent RNA methyltransferase n=1 Tax=Algiphilus sp. TaxID=1872431 RepID=UPI003B52B860
MIPTTPALRGLHRAQVKLALQVLAEVAEDGAAADRALARQVRGNRKLGAKDRRWLAALVYGVLRQVCQLRARAGDEPAAWLSALLVDDYAAEAEQLRRFGLPEPPPPMAATTATARNWPPWLNEAAEAHFSAARCDAIAEAMAGQAGVDLRVNRLRCTPEQALQALRPEGVAVDRVPDATLALRLSQRQPLQQTAAWRQGWIEPQDVGSQWICALVEARPGEQIADWCAGAGGKALALAADQDDRGTILALDTDAARLSRIEARAQRLGVGSISTASLSRDGRLDPALLPEGGFDAVLVDAPCSGSGTLRRHPEQVLRAVDLDALARQQLAILEQAARAVRRGGRLVYATCSFLPQENDAVVARFLANHSAFSVVEAARILSVPPASDSDPWLRTLPDVSACDGFCALRLVRER